MSASQTPTRASSAANPHTLVTASSHRPSSHPHRRTSPPDSSVARLLALDLPQQPSRARPCVKGTVPRAPSARHTMQPCAVQLHAAGSRHLAVPQHTAAVRQRFARPRVAVWAQQQVQQTPTASCEQQQAPGSCRSLESVLQEAGIEKDVLCSVKLVGLCVGGGSAHGRARHAAAPRAWCARRVAADSIAARDDRCHPTNPARAAQPGPERRQPRGPRGAAAGVPDGRAGAAAPRHRGHAAALPAPLQLQHAAPGAAGGRVAAPRPWL